MAFSLEAVFGVDATGVRATMKSLRKDFTSFVSTYTKLGAGVAVAAFVGLSKGAMDLASKLKHTSDNLGMNVESLQALQMQHRANGVSQEQLTKALEKTKSAVIAAADGNKSATESLAKLGLKAADLIRLPLDKQYEAIARGAASATDQNKAFAAISSIMGEKVGPQLMSSLRDLADRGLPEVMKSAQAAGQVMSAETIVALEKAGTAIDDFKRHATVAIGNIIVNFRSEEGIELLKLQFMKAVSMFGAKIADAIVESGQMLWAVYSGAWKGIFNYVRDGFAEVIIGAAKLLNKILPSKFEINVGNLEALRSSGKGIADEITDAIAKTSPSTFTEDVGSAFDLAIAEQRKIVDAINATDLGPEADKLRDAGEAAKTAIAEGGAEGAAKIAEAGKSAGDDIAAAAETIEEAGEYAGEHLFEFATAAAKAFAAQLIPIIGTSVRGGNSFNDASDDALAEIVRRNRNEAARLRNPALTPGNHYLDRLEAGRLEAEAQNAQNELNLRSLVRSSYERGGTDGVYRALGDRDPIILQKLIDQFAKQTPLDERNTIAVEKIARGLKTTFGWRD